MVPVGSEAVVANLVADAGGGSVAPSASGMHASPEEQQSLWEWPSAPLPPHCCPCTMHTSSSMGARTEQLQDRM